MRTKTVSLLITFAFLLLSATPAFAIRLDGINGDEYSTKEYQTLFQNSSESGNNASLAQAFIKTENTFCYILFNVLCDDVDENKAELKNNKAAGVIITADGETFKADLTGTDYGGYNKNKFDFNYAPMIRTGGFTLEVAINFKNGIGDGKTITVKVMDGSGTESAMRDVKVKPPEELPTALEKTTKTAAEKTTKEKTTKTTTEKTTKEKTTKATTAKTTAEKAKTTVQEKSKREITHRVVTTTIKTQSSIPTEKTQKVKTTKAVTTKFRAERNDAAVTAIEQSGASESNIGSVTGTVSYSYITDEYTTVQTTTERSKSKKKVAAMVSAGLVIAACVFGTVSKKDKSEEDEKSEGS